MIMILGGIALYVLTVVLCFTFVIACCKDKYVNKPIEVLLVTITLIPVLNVFTLIGAFTCYFCHLLNRWVKYRAYVGHMNREKRIYGDDFFIRKDPTKNPFRKVFRNYISFAPVALQRDGKILKLSAEKMSKCVWDIESQFAGIYPIVNLNFLKSRESDNLPTFGVYQIDQTTCSIKIKRTDDGEFDHSIIGVGIDQSNINYDLFIDILMNMATELYWKFVACLFPCVNYEYGIVSYYQGKPLPRSIRQLINGERTNFDSIYIVAYAKQWTKKDLVFLREKEVRRTSHFNEVLVIGIKNRNAFLLTSFNWNKE